MLRVLFGDYYVVMWALVKFSLSGKLRFVVLE